MESPRLVKFLVTRGEVVKQDVFIKVGKGCDG